MKTKYFIFAASALVALASCSNDEYIGDNNGLTAAEGDGSIQFSYTMPNATRADISGAEAADKLGGNFYVVGTKGTEPATTPTTQAVFDNYLVHYTANTAGTTESNTANWEYVGVKPGEAPLTNYAKLSPATVTAQTIKYWDYSVSQYDFFAFSVGKGYSAVKAPEPYATPTGSTIYVTPMKYGAALAGGAVSYTFGIPSAEALGQVYVTDIVEVTKTSGNYGKDVVLKFKNLGAKIRLALYETVPGYSIDASSIKFYTEDNGSFGDNQSTAVQGATLISGNATGLANVGKVDVSFLNVGTNNESNSNYNKASVTVTPDVTNPANYELYKTFGAMDATTKATAEASEAAGKLYIGRTLPAATFAGDKNSDYYQLVFPVSTSSPLTLRVDYTLLSTDGSGEAINVYGAKAVVPATYTKWQPNYAYTYIFKISDNTNGRTSKAVGDPDGLFPITFDAVVANFTEVSGEQTTVTTVATPSITTYQQGHTYGTNEYSKTTKGKDNVVRSLYVQVMDNTTTTAKFVGFDGSTLPALNDNTHEDGARALLYKVDDTHAATATEALVMDALQNRTSAIGADDVTGRNGVTLTKNANIDATVNKIVNDVNDNKIDITAGQAAKIDIANAGVTAGTYAFVYDYSDDTEDKTVVDEYQQIIATSGSAIGVTDETHYAKIATADLKTMVATPANLTVDEGGVEGKGEAVADTHIYFALTTTDGGATYTYSYVSVVGKDRVPAGLLKVAKTNASLVKNINGSTTVEAGYIYFDVYKSNNGSYAVKVIKVVPAPVAP